MTSKTAKAMLTDPTEKTYNEGGLFHSLKKWLLSLGPGLIVAALVFGPSKMTITSKLGAEYGYALLWIVVVAIFFMVIFTSHHMKIKRWRRNTIINAKQQLLGFIFSYECRKFSSIIM